MHILNIRPGTRLPLREDTPGYWVDQPPAYLLGDIPVSAGPGNIDGAIFCFWIGDKDVNDRQLLDTITTYLTDQDVVGVRFIRDMPKTVHAAIQDRYQEILTALPREAIVEPAQDSCATSDKTTGAPGAPLHTEPSDGPSILNAMKINVRCRFLHTSQQEDAEVEGQYRVTFKLDQSGVSEEKRAAMALDIFHAHIGIHTLDDYDIDVLDQNDQPIGQDESHVDNSASDYGYVAKIDDAPLWLVGSDDGMTADELDERYNPNGDGEHPRHTRNDWRDAVSSETTISGYWAWVVYMLLSDATDTPLHLRAQQGKIEGPPA